MAHTLPDNVYPFPRSWDISNHWTCVWAVYTFSFFTTWIVTSYAGNFLTRSIPLTCWLISCFLNSDSWSSLRKRRIVLNSKEGDDLPILKNLKVASTFKGADESKSKTKMMYFNCKLKPEEHFQDILSHFSDYFQIEENLKIIVM